MVEDRVRLILALSDESTVERRQVQEDGTEVVRRVRKPADVPAGRTSWSVAPGTVAPTPGTVVREYDLEKAPTVILVDDAGNLVVATDEAVIAIATDGSESQLADAEAGVLQWDSDGDRLLMAGPGVKRVISWPRRELAADFGGRDLRGRMQFAPEGNGYWLAEDHVDFDASQPMRIFWSVSEFDGAGELRPLAQYHPASFAGTCPQNGLVWTVAIEKHRIVPEAGSLQENDVHLAFVRSLTDAGESLDFAPVADRGNRIYFLRAPRLVDGAMRRTARAWTRDLNGDAPERQLTAEPTFAVAVSPGGTRAAFVVLRGSHAALLSTDVGAVLASDISGPIAARAAFESSVEEMLGDLRGAYAAAVPEGAPPIAEEIGDQIPWPTEDLVGVMARSLASALKERFGIDADGSVGSLGAIDDLLAEADGLVPEEEATIIAFAGYEGQVIARASDARWMLSTSSPALGVDTDAVTTGDDLLMSFHNPFYTVREAFAGRVALHDVVRELLAEWRQPLALVENASYETEQAWFAGRLQDAGVNADADIAGALREAALRAPDNNIVSKAAITSAKSRLDSALRLLAALNLAEANPDSAEALVAAAEAVQPLGRKDLRIALCRQAERISPDDPGVLAESASAYFAAGMFDEARERYRRLATLDAGGAYSQLVREALEDIERLGGAEGKAPQ